MKRKRRNSKPQKVDVARRKRNVLTHTTMKSNTYKMRSKSLPWHPMFLSKDKTHAVFFYLSKIGIGMNPGEKVVIVRRDVTEDRYKFYASSNTRFIHILMTGNPLGSENVVLHEVIQDMPIKMFLDVDAPNFSTSNFKAAKKCFLNQLDDFAKAYMFLLQSHFGSQDVEGMFLILDSSDEKKKKISFHMIAIHTFEGLPIFFKNANHLMYLIKNHLNRSVVTRHGNTLWNYVDDDFPIGKSLRMYMSGKQGEPERKLRVARGGESLPYDQKTMELSLLQNYYPERGFIMLESVGFNKSLEEEEKIPIYFLPEWCGGRNKKKKGNPKQERKRRRNLPVVDVGADMAIVRDFCQGFLNHLKNRKRRTRVGNRNFTFGHLRPKNFHVRGRVQRQGDYIYINLDNRFLECHIQKHVHGHKSGRKLFLMEYPRVRMWCRSNTRENNHCQRLDIWIPQDGTEKKLCGLFKEIKEF
jgi:hypothetical protein